MKPPKAVASDPWAQWCALLALEAPTYGSQRRCQHLRPGWSKTQVQQMLTQTQAALRLLNRGDPFQDYSFLQDKNWLKEGARHAKALVYLKGFLSLSETLKAQLPEYQSLWPVLKSELGTATDVPGHGPVRAGHPVGCCRQ